MRVFIPALMRPLRPFLFGSAFSLMIGLAPGLSSVAFGAEDEMSSEPEGKMDERPASIEQDMDDEEAPFRRGFFATGELGGYFSIGGIKTGDGSFASKSVSNFQPMVGLTFGYDVFTNESMNLSAGLRFAMGFNSTSAVVSADQAVASGEGTSYPEDFDITQIGLALKLGLLVGERGAVNIVADGGLGMVSPDPTVPGSDPNAGGIKMGVTFGAGVGGELATLFPGFSVGLEAKFVGTIAGEFIPGVSIAIPLKYNF